MCKKLIYLVSFICVLSIAAGAQATPIPVNVDPSVEAVIGADGNLNPNKSFATYNLQVSNVLSNLAQGRRVTLISYDISGLKKDYQYFTNMTLSILGGNSSGKVDIYGVIEDQDNIDSGLTWKNAPGVKNDLPIGYPVVLDEADLTGKLLSLTSPARDERKSFGSAELDDFLNSDTDGVVTILLAPAGKGVNALMKSSMYADGGVILEGEITTGINIIWVSQERDFDQDGVQDDQGFVDILNADGHNVDARLNYWDQLDAEPEKIGELNAADLVIVSRGTASGDFNAQGEATAWNSVTTPLIQMSGYLLRSSRWLWVNSTSIINFEAPTMQAVINNSPLFDGLELDADDSIDVLDPSVGVQDPNDPAQIGQTTFLGIVPEEIGNGIVLANTMDGIVWIAIWNAGIEFYDGAGQIPFGKRMMFPCGAQEHQTEPLTPWGAMNLSENGQALLLNAVLYMTQPPSPSMAAHWPMDDGEGTVVTDVVGDNNGEIVGNVTWIEGVLDGAVTYDTTDPNAAIAVPNSDELDFGDVDFSISMWVRYPVAPGTNQHELMTKGTTGAPGTGKRYTIFHKGDRMRFEIDNDISKSSLQVSDASFITGEWVHLVAVRDSVNDQLLMYADGVLLGTATDSSEDISSGEDMYIGNSPPIYGNNVSEADIDDVRIYNVAITQDVVGSIYTGLIPVTIPIPVENFSFELPGTEKIKGWNGEGVAGTPAEDIPGWASDTEVADSGVESDWPGSTDGVWSAFIMGDDPSIWNLTNHIIAGGEIITFNIDLQDNWTDGGLPDVAISLYYDDAGTRVTVASATVTPLDQSEGGWTEFSVGFAADDAPDSIGKQLGIEIDALSASSWIGADNARVDVIISE